MKMKHSLYNVKTKGGLFNLKINPNTRDEFKAAAEIRGATMSSLIHQYIFQVIREAKRDTPIEFEAKLAEITAEKQASSSITAPSPVKAYSREKKGGDK